MTKGDVGIDLGLDKRQLRQMDEDALKQERRERMPGVGLLLIYPIDKNSTPVGKKDKVSLEAVENVIALGFVFPPADPSSKTSQNYVTVDPAKLDRSDYEFDEEEDLEG